MTRIIEFPGSGFGDHPIVMNPNAGGVKARSDDFRKQADRKTEIFRLQSLCGIEQLFPVNSRPRRQSMLFPLARFEKMPDRSAPDGQRIRDQGAVATPWQCFRTHEDDSPCSR